LNTDNRFEKTVNMDNDKLLHKDLTDSIIGIYYNVYNELGYGFLESVYHNAMIIALRKAGHKAESQKRIVVYFEKQAVGEYYADMMVDGLVILEFKTAVTLSQEHEYQLINYLRATNVEVGLLLNFGRRAEFKSKLFTNDKKNLGLSGAYGSKD